MSKTLCICAALLSLLCCGCDWKPEKAPDRRNDAAERAARKFTGGLKSDEHHTVPGPQLQQNLEKKIKSSTARQSEGTSAKKSGKKQPRSKRK